ncbi:MAG: DUF423 domain-containing protein [Geminicoccaceae bacterium]
MQQRHWIALAAALGLMGVAFGAFGAHGLEAGGDARAAQWLATGSHYQLVHAAAILAAIAWGRQGVLPAALWAVGAILFPGSLYALALGAPKAVAALAPAGGMALLLGWASLGWQALRAPR